MIHDILLAHDFSPSSERALRYGLDLADRTGATLHLMHVDEIKLGPLVQGEPSPQRGTNTLEKNFEERCRTFLDAQPHTPDEDRLHYHVERSGAVASSLVEAAEDHTFDLILMGTQGRRGVQGAFLGSVAREVLRTAPCPVFTTRALPDDEEATTSIERIVAPIDFSESSREALQYTSLIASIYEAPVKLVHVIEAPKMPPVYELESPKLTSRKIKARAERALEEWGSSLQAGDKEVSYVVHSGDPASTILDAAPNPTDLLVMATRGLSGLRRTMLGSVTESVLCEALGPIIAARQFPSNG